MWSPITPEALREQVEADLPIMDPGEVRVWHLIRIPPVKWQLTPWGDLGGGFWVVGLIGRLAVWYNDIEGGFELARYDDFGVLPPEQYHCNQGGLQGVIHDLRRRLDVLDSAIVPGHYGAPDQPEIDSIR